MKTLILLAAFSAAAAGAAFDVQLHPAPGKPAMILIPGLASHGSVWDATVEHFRGRYEMHVLTLAGFAGAPPLAQRGDFLAQQRDAIAAYIRDQKLNKPVLTGHSLGGFLALSIAARHPDLPGPLVIVDSLPFLSAVYVPGATPESARPQAEAMRKMMLGMQGEAWERYQQSNPALALWLSRDEDRARVSAWGAASDPATAAEAMFDLMTSDLRPGLPLIAQRALVFAPLKGMPEAAIGAYRAQYEGLKGVRLEPMPEARHFIMYDDPVRLHKLMDEFLAEAR